MNLPREEVPASDMAHLRGRGGRQGIQRRQGRDVGGGGAVDPQAQQVGPAVVADAVHHPFVFGDQGGIELGDGEAFAFGQGTGQVAPLLGLITAVWQPPWKALWRVVSAVMVM